MSERWKQPLKDYSLVLVVPHEGGTHNVRHRAGDGFEAIHQSGGELMDNYPASMDETALDALLEASESKVLADPQDTPYGDFGLQGGVGL